MSAVTISDMSMIRLRGHEAEDLPRSPSLLLRIFSFLYRISDANASMLTWLDSADWARTGWSGPAPPALCTAAIKLFSALFYEALVNDIFALKLTLFDMQMYLFVNAVVCEASSLQTLSSRRLFCNECSTEVKLFIHFGSSCQIFSSGLFFFFRPNSKTWLSHWRYWLNESRGENKTKKQHRIKGSLSEIWRSGAPEIFLHRLLLSSRSSQLNEGESRRRSAAASDYPDRWLQS